MLPRAWRVPTQGHKEFLVFLILQPTPEPTKYFKTEDGAQCPLHGSWQLLFTTAGLVFFGPPWQLLFTTSGFVGLGGG